MTTVARRKPATPSGDSGKPAAALRTGSRGRATKTARKDLMHAELLNKAAELFMQRGYANTRMKDIADAMGMDRSSLYHYFENKEEILLVLTEGDVETATESLEKLLKSPAISWEDKLRGWIEGNIREKLAGGIRFRLVDRIQGDLPERYHEVFRRARRQVLDLLVQIIEGGIRAGEFGDTDPKITAFAVIGMSNWTAWWYAPNGRSTPDEIARCMTDLVLGGVLRAKASTNTRPDIEAAISQLKSAQQTLESLLQEEGE